jgi:hypothetical protein
MSDIDNRMTLSVTELVNLNDWLGRIKYTVSNIELRRHVEPGMGPAITAFVETSDDEGYYKLLTAENTFLNTVETNLKSALAGSVTADGK